MGALYYVGFNGYRQCPSDRVDVLPNVIKTWSKFCFKSPVKIQLTFKYVVVRIDSVFSVYGLLSSSLDDTYKSITCPLSSIHTFLATDDFLIIAQGNKLWKSPYDDTWAPIDLSHAANDELWRDKIIVKMCFMYSNREFIILLNDGSVWKLKDSCLSVLFTPCSERAIDISCGLEHGIILTQSGSVLSFGNGSRGQLGHGDLDGKEVPLKVKDLSHVKIKKVAAGGWHTCAVTHLGDLYIWGWNNYGQVTDIREENDEGDGYGVMPYPMLICDVDPEKGVVVDSIACGTRHTALLTDDDTLYSTGWNEYSQLGIDSSFGKKFNKFMKVQSPEMNGKKRLLMCGPWSLILYEDQVSSS